MPRFRKRSTVIEAEQYDPRNYGGELPLGCHQEAYGDNAFINTANGRVTVYPGDWVCRQTIDGKIDIWPVRQDIFAATYERVDETL